MAYSKPGRSPACQQFPLSALSPGAPPTTSLSLTNMTRSAVPSSRTKRSRVIFGAVFVAALLFTTLYHYTQPQKLTRWRASAADWLRPDLELADTLDLEPPSADGQPSEPGGLRHGHESHRPLSAPHHPPTVAARPDYFKGRWVYDATHSPYSRGGFGTCPVAPLPGEAKSATTQRGVSRAQEIAKWAWEPAGDRDWPGWTPEQLLERLVQSRMGLTMIGDSLTGQHFARTAKFLEGAKRPAGPMKEPLLREPAKAELDQWPTVFQKSPGSVVVYLLSESWGRQLFPSTDPDRFSRPLLTYIRADFLVHTHEVSQFLGPGFTVEHRKEAHPEYWREWVSTWLSPPLPPSRAGAPHDQRSIIVLNTGAHWTAHKVMGGGDRSLEVPRLHRAYGLTADAVLGFLRPYAAEIHLVYRTISPGHPGCSEDREQKVPSLPDAAAAQQEPWNRYGWEEFPALDRIWKGKLAAVQESEQEAQWGWKIDVMDIWDQAVARGDAKLRPHKKDCLHWCIYFIPTHWMNGLNHIVLGS